MSPMNFFLFSLLLATVECNSGKMPQCTFGLTVDQLEKFSIVNADLVCKLEFFPDRSGLSIVGATEESFVEVYKHEFRLFNASNACNRSPKPFANGQFTFYFALQWFCGRFCYDSNPTTFVEMDCMYDPPCPMPPFLCKCLDVDRRIVNQRVVRPGQLAAQYDSACLNCYQSDLGDLKRADKCDKTWENVVKRRTGRIIAVKPVTTVTPPTTTTETTTTSTTTKTTTTATTTTFQPISLAKYLIRQGFNYGCTMTDSFVGSIEQCQTDCDSHLECLSFQYSEGQCSLKNCVTDTVMKGTTGEPFYVKESYFLSKETEMIDYELKFGNCDGFNLDGNFLSGSVENCASFCDKEANCKGFWYMGNSCQLKSEICDSVQTRAIGNMFYIKVIVETTTSQSQLTPVTTTNVIETTTTTVENGKSSKYIERRGSNFGCTIVELVRPDIKLCRTECDDRPDCLSLEYSESGYCALKNCVTDTVMKGDQGEMFHVKESYFLKKEAEVSGYQLQFGSCDSLTSTNESGRPEKCAQICNSHSDCAGFWYMGEICQMKKSICPTVTKRGSGDMFYVKI